MEAELHRYQALLARRNLAFAAHRHQSRTGPCSVGRATSEQNGFAIS
jgi:hypothetical protein